MAKNKQVDLLLHLLRRFDEAGVLHECILIGSWCLHFYRFQIEEPEQLPAVRTMDVDFLVSRPKQIKQEVDIPALLKQDGFIPVFNRSNHMIKYQHPELLVEFLIPEMGRGSSMPQEIKKWHVKAVKLRYLNLLAAHTRMIAYRGIKIRVPEPSVFAIHKLIISSRRLKKDKREKDLEAAIGVLNWVFNHPDEVKKLKRILKSLPTKWLTTLSRIAKKHFLPLFEMIQTLS